MLFGKLKVTCLQILTDFSAAMESAAEKGRHLDFPPYYSATLPLDDLHKPIYYSAIFGANWFIFDKQVQKSILKEKATDRGEFIAKLCFLRPKIRNISKYYVTFPFNHDRIPWGQVTLKMWKK